MKHILVSILLTGALLSACFVSYASEWSDVFGDEDYFVEQESSSNDQNEEQTETELLDQADGNIFYTTSELNIRDNPEGNIIGTYQAYEEVEVFETKDGWSKTKDGWVSNDYLSEHDLSSAGTIDDYNERALKENTSFSKKVQFFSDEAKEADYSHVSDTLFVTITSNTYGDGFYYLTHVITKDPSRQMKDALSYDSFGGTMETPSSVAERTGAVLATNASNFISDTGEPPKGVCIYDGQIMRGGTTRGREICMTGDGTLFSAPEGISDQDLLDMGVVYTWVTVRPTLIEDGDIKTIISDELNPKRPDYGNEPYPRCAYGMVEPGEYYIITAGTSDYNGGLTQIQMQEIFATLGCTYARPMDEGGSATLVFENQLINTPAAGEERTAPDIIYYID